MRTASLLTTLSACLGLSACLAWSQDAAPSAPSPIPENMRRAGEWEAAPIAMSQLLPVKPDTISAARLRHKIPKQAKTLYARAVKLSQAGKYREAARELELAITADPEYAEAHNQLGVQYIFLLRIENAKGELRRAIQLDPAFADAHINLAWVEFQTGGLASAEQLARRAVALSGRMQARLLLNAILARSGH